MTAPKFRQVEQHSGVVASPPPAPCALPHHNRGRRVGFQTWDRTRGEWATTYGTVQAHVSRTLTIRTDDGAQVLMSCGPVLAVV